MLDLRIVREKTDEVEKSLARRHGGFSIASLVKTDSEWRALQSEHEDLNRRTNEISQQFKTGQAADKEGLRKEHSYKYWKNGSIACILLCLTCQTIPCRTVLMKLIT